MQHFHSQETVDRAVRIFNCERGCYLSDSYAVECLRNAEQVAYAILNAPNPPQVVRALAAQLDTLAGASWAIFDVALWQVQSELDAASEAAAGC